MAWPANGGREEDRAVEELLKRQARPPKPVGGPLCGDAELLAAFAEGSLAGSAREEFERHLAACAACAEAVTRLVRLAPREAAAPAAAPARAWWPRWAWAAPVLAGVLLVGSLAWLGREQIRQDQPTLEARKAQVEAPARQKEVAPAKEQPAAPQALSETQPATSAAGGAPRAGAAGGGKRQAATSRLAPAEKSTPAEFAPSPPVAAEMAHREASAPAAAQDKPEARQDALAKVESVPEPAKPAARDEMGAVAAGQLKARPAPEANAYREPKAQAEQDAAGRREERAGLAAKAMRPVPAQSAPVASAVESKDRAASPPALQAGRTTALKRGAAKSGSLKAPVEGAVGREQWVGTRQVWVLMADGRLFSSSDGGQSWAQLQVPETPRTFSFQDEKSGEIVARSGERYVTGDGGQTWKKAGSEK